MKITLISNYLNHHQIPLVLELQGLGAEVVFIATTTVEEERMAMHYKNCNEEYDFVIEAYKGEEETKRAIEAIKTSDAVILGALDFRNPISARRLYVATALRRRDGMLTYTSSERILKTGLIKAIHPKIRKKLAKRHGVYDNDKVFLLCAGGYTAYDFNLFGLYKGRTLTWGYFPEQIELEKEQLKRKDDGLVKVIWVGRLIDWKKCDEALRAAKHLKDKNITFEMKIIGDGEEREKLVALAEKLGVASEVKFLGSLPGAEVKKEMLEADICLFTSGYKEGWGAVLSEAMGSGCAVVASHAGGAAATLIKHGINGFIYKSGRVSELCRYTEALARDYRTRTEIGEAAYSDMQNLWSPEIAAQRLVEHIRSVNSGDRFAYSEGPCSKAELISQFKMYSYLTSKKQISD